jgi:hypothetical protein
MPVSLAFMVTLTDAEEADHVEAKPMRFGVLVGLMSACSAAVFCLACWLYI